MTYEKFYNDIFDTTLGRETFRATREAVKTFTGEFNSMQVIETATSIAECLSTWAVLNSLDHFVSLGELIELTNRDKVHGMDRRYNAI